MVEGAAALPLLATTHNPSNPLFPRFPLSQEAFKPLTKWWKELLRSDARIESVKISKRLSSTPCVVLASKVRALTKRFQPSIDETLTKPFQPSKVCGVGWLV